MSVLISDENREIAQCLRLPVTGSTTNVTTLATANISTAALSAGIYRIISSVDVHISSGPVGTAATASDMEMRANSPEYFYVNSQWIVSAYDAGAGGGVVSVTRMP